MQYLKEDVKDKIIASALKEFSQKGFLGASIRDIAHNANVATGNVYRYFENKHDLFDFIIGPIYNKITDYILDIVRVSDSSVNAICQINSIKDKLLEIFKLHSTEFLILMDKSQDTRYENTKEELILQTDNIIKSKLFDCLVEKGFKIRDESMSYVLSSTLVEGICIILRNYEDVEKINFLVGQLIDILFDDIQNRLK